MSSNLRIGEWKVQVEPEPFGINNRIYLYQRDPQGVRALRHDGVLKLVKNGEKSDDDYFAVLDDEQLQALSEGLAAKGLKTTDTARVEATLSAQSAHLEDMRRLVFQPQKGSADEPSTVQPN